MKMLQYGTAKVLLWFYIAQQAKSGTAGVLFH